MAYLMLFIWISIYISIFHIKWINGELLGATKGFPPARSDGPQTDPFHFGWTEWTPNVPNVSRCGWFLPHSALQFVFWRSLELVLAKPCAWFWGNQMLAGMGIGRKKGKRLIGPPDRLGWASDSTDTLIIELDDGKIYRKALYLMVKTMVSCRFSQQNQSNDLRSCQPQEAQWQRPMLTEWQIPGKPESTSYLCAESVHIFNLSQYSSYMSIYVPCWEIVHEKGFIIMVYSYIIIYICIHLKISMARDDHQPHLAPSWHQVEKAKQDDDDLSEVVRPNDGKNLLFLGTALRSF